MAFIGEVGAYLKADNSDFRTKMVEAGQSVEGLDKSLKKFGLGFGGVAALATAFRAIVDHARDLTGPLDENQRRAKDFAKGLDEAKKNALDVGVQVMGVVNGIGEWIGRQVALVKYGKEQVAIAEQIEKQTRETLAAIEKDREITKEIARLREQTRDVEKQTSEESKKQLDIKDRILLAEAKLQAAIDARNAAEGNKVEKAKAELEVAKARGELMKVHAEQQKKFAEDEKKWLEERNKAHDEHVKLLQKNNQARFEAQSTEEKILTYEESIRTLTELITQGKKEGRDVSEDQALLDNNLIELAKLRSELEAKNKVTLEDQVKELQKQGMSREQMIETLKAQGHHEDEILKKIQKQNQELQIGFQIRGRYDEDLSTRALEDKVRTLQKSVADRERSLFGQPGGVGGGGVPYDPLLNFERTQLSEAQAELNARRNLERNVARYGEEGAAKLYRGNIPEFERLLQLMDPDVSKKQLSLLDEINQRLKNSGLFPKR